MGAKRAVAAAKDLVVEADRGRVDGRQARPSTLTFAGVTALQRTIGNAAVARLMAAGAQPKLKVGPAGDAFEREADLVADEVMRARSAPSPAPPVAPVEEDEREVQRSARPHEDASVGLEGGDLGSGVERELRGASSGGSALPGGVRRSMEGALGADLSAVRVHTGDKSDSLNQHMQSRAFTLGSNIFFAKGQYQPGSTGGQHLLAHELTHTIQQSASTLDEAGKH